VVGRARVVDEAVDGVERARPFALRVAELGSSVMRPFASDHARHPLELCAQARIALDELVVGGFDLAATPWRRAGSRWEKSPARRRAALRASAPSAHHLPSASRCWSVPRWWRS